MNLTNRNVFLIAMVMLCIILLTVLTGIIISEEDDHLPDDDFLEAVSYATAWFRIPVHQLSFILMLGMSIFALVVVYLGGRSNHKRFNDRTIELVKLLPVAFSMTALLRAVFNFLFSDTHSDHTKNKLTSIFLFPNLIYYIKEVFCHDVFDCWIKSQIPNTRRYSAMMRSIVSSSLKFQIQGGILP